MLYNNIVKLIVKGMKRVAKMAKGPSAALELFVPGLVFFSATYSSISVSLITKI